MTLCLCGCGQEIENDRNYVHGHNTKNKGWGHKMSDVGRNNISSSHKGKTAWNKGLTKEDERVAKNAKAISSSLKGRPWEDVYGKESAEIKREQQSKALLGESSHFWLGGKSFEPYTLDFNAKIKRFVKNRDGRCMNCNVSTDDLRELKRKICAHHIDYNKLNSFPQNLVCLCSKCHSPTNQNRQHWTVFFQSMLKEQYGYQYTEDQKIIIDFEKVIENGKN